MPLGYRYLHVPGHGGSVSSYAVYMLPDKVALELRGFRPGGPAPGSHR